MTTEYADNALEEVIDGVPEQATETNKPEDRGDVIEPELSPDALKELVEENKPAVEPEHATKPGGIPKARFDEVNEAKKEYQQQLEEAHQEIERLRTTAQQAQQAAPAFDEDAKEQAYIDAMLDGDASLAKSIRREINANLRQQAMYDMESSMTQRQAANALQAESAAAMESYPYLDTKEGALALKLIIDARDADIARGVQAHIALRNAVNAIAPRFQTDDTPTKVSTSAANHIDTRSRDAIKRGADDSIRQPPSLTQGIGNRTTAARVDVESMDDEQFDGSDMDSPPISVSSGEFRQRIAT